MLPCTGGGIFHIRYTTRRKTVFNATSSEPYRLFAARSELRKVLFWTLKHFV